MTRVYGEIWKGKYSNYSAHFRAYMDYTVDTTHPMYVKVTVIEAGLQKTRGSTPAEMVKGSGKYVSVSVSTSSVKYDKTSSSVKFSHSNPDAEKFGGGKVFTIAKGTNPKRVNIRLFGKKTSGAWAGESAVDLFLDVPALEALTLSFDANDNPAVVPDNITAYYGVPVNIPTYIPETSGKVFVHWIGFGRNYFPGDEITLTKNCRLLAQWSAIDPPVCDCGQVVIGAGYSKIISGFSPISVEISNITVMHNRLASARLFCGPDKSSPVIAGDTSVILTLIPTEIGEQEVSVRIQDTAGAYSVYRLGTVTVNAPVWSREVTYQKASYLPPDRNGNNAILTVLAYNYSQNTFDEIKGNYEITEDDESWSFDVLLDSEHVSDGTSLNPDSEIIVTYNHSETGTKDSNKAFFRTSRSANFSNGIYNTMFVSGCLEKDCNSRVWWSYANNPLYFPDLNYVEVGSNDTAVQGLIKVSDYLGVIKKSKTTDTAIYLLYATSFEQETTYAVKQGVQGIGAIAQYAFNILGDETLFLSPNGVMAIEPSQDDEHKVRNRSYFIDGKLLKESDLDIAYSFVYDGKYYLSFPNGNVYVLDGNQRNSWGNDKTNLVYECYFLENIPATCWMKYNDELWFSNDLEVCRFREKSSGDAFVDDYDMNTGDMLVPVKAEWSTLLDDDGSLHYYKTMHKKGNVVSILPTSQNAQETNSTKVFVKKDDNEEVEVQRSFGPVGNIPSELFMNKKFKKYKRLQIIVRNNADEDFGVDSITKCYTIGNYAKR